MNRLGFRPGDVAGVCQRLASSPSVAALRLMMHFARADEDDGLAEPLEVFERACKGLAYPRSLANSAGVIRFDEVGGDIVRPGIMLYGASPFLYDTADMIGLLPVMTLRSQLIAVQELKANESVGYGASYIASAWSPAGTPTAIPVTRPMARRCSSAAGRCAWPVGRRWTCSRWT
jgi:alanine racemase